MRQPRPISTSVPTIARTMWRRKPSPAISYSSSPSRRRHSERVTVRTADELSLPTLRNALKSWVPTKRVAARAMASKPQLLLFDDPITGLDPLIATTIDDEIVKLRDLEDVTTFVVTHQIRDAFYIAEHRAASTDGRIEVVKEDASKVLGVEFMVLHDGKIMFQGNASELLAAKDSYLVEYLYRTLPPW